MVHYLPQELLPGDLIAGGRFNIQTSTCLDEKQARAYLDIIDDEFGLRQSVMDFHNHGYGNAGCTSGHLIPDYPRVIQKGFFAIHEEIMNNYNKLDKAEKIGPKGAQLLAMLTAATMPGDLSEKYRGLCTSLAPQEEALKEKQHRKPWRTTWPGVSFGRIDQYRYPLWQKSQDEGMDREFGKEILKCFWIHANTAYDFMIRTRAATRVSQPDTVSC